MELNLPPPDSFVNPFKSALTAAWQSRIGIVPAMTGLVARAGSALLFLLTLSCAPAWAACSIQALEIPVRIVNSRPIATMTVNGVELPMLVDSGAFFSFLSASTATQLNLRLSRLPDGFRLYGHTGQIAARLTRVDEVEFGGVKIPRVEFLVGGNELGSGIRGILGRNFLGRTDVEYDLAHGVMRLIFPKGDCDEVNLAYWAGNAPVISTPIIDLPDGRPDMAILVQALVNGKKMEALLDTGAATTSLTLDAAKRAGLQESELKLIGKVGGAGAGFVRSWQGEIASFEMGGEKIINNQLQIDDTRDSEQDLLIGLDYFLSHRIYVSKLQRKLYATWNGGPVFARSGAEGVYDPRYAALPAPVADDDADGLARRAAVAMTRGDYARALEDLDRACQLAPDNAAHFEARAKAQLALKHSTEALRDYDEALRLQPTRDSALLGRAALHARLHDRAQAMNDLQQLDARLPPSAPQRSAMANSYARLDLAPEALRQWELWIANHRYDAGLARVLNNRCWLRARLAIELDKALDDCKDAVRIERTEGNYHDSLGWTWLRLGDAARAANAFDAAVERRASAWSLYGRALALRRQGKTAEAQRDLDAARQLDAHIDDDIRQAGFGALLDAP